MLRAYRKIRETVRREFSDLVVSSQWLGKRSPGSSKLRLILRDKSFIDIWLSPSGKYSYHWERRAQTGRIYRFDNAPDHPHLSTHPHHLHEGIETTIRPSMLPKHPIDRLRHVLKFVREKFQITSA